MVFHGSRSGFMIFLGSRSVFYGFYGYSRFKGDISRFQVGFHGARSVFMVFKVPRRFFMVIGGFLWLFKVPG